MVVHHNRYFQLAALLLVSVFITSAQKLQRLREQHPWYHTGDEIRAELGILSSSCSGATLSISIRTYQGEENQPSVELDVVRISQDNTTHGKQKAFFVFGEHARELISPESALHFVRLLCGGGDSSDRELVQEALQHTTFVVVPNANPLGRKQVEMGHYCKRTNEDDVDLNRNWADDGAQRNPTSMLGLDKEVNPGPHAFSEPETIMLRSILAEEKPDVFVSVHSGAYLLGIPPSKSEAPTGAKSQQQMSDVLGRISQQFCDGDCPFGDLTDVIGYKSQGCDIDYVRNYMETPYAFTWEIYANADIRKFFAEKAHARAEGREMRGAAKTYFSMKSLMLLQTQERRHFGRQLRGHAKLVTSGNSYDDDECFDEFNPNTQAETEQVVATWGRAFITLCNELNDISSAGTPML